MKENKNQLFDDGWIDKIILYKRQCMICGKETECMEISTDCGDTVFGGYVAICIQCASKVVNKQFQYSKY